MGHSVRVVGPDMARWCTRPLPFYPDIKIELFPRARLLRVLAEYAPDYVHIATEGTLGWASRRICLQQNRPFTTSYHTQFPEYVAARVPRFMQRVTLDLVYVLARHFHAPAAAVMVATQSMTDLLQRRNFHNLVRWSRGVDTGLFHDYGRDVSIYAGFSRPILLNVGRVAVEKNLEAFLRADVAGSKVVIGAGPDLEMLKHKYPSAHFLGFMEGEVLARHYAAADIFVFPSKTDTFGLVLLEACAAGLRVACYPAPGPLDIFNTAETHEFAVLDDDFARAITRASALPENREKPRHFAENYSWEACTQQFYQHAQARKPVVSTR